MQFGRIHGIALAILGIVLLGIQTVYYMMPTTAISGPTAVSRTVPHAVNPVFGVVGLILLACRCGRNLNREPPRRARPQKRG
jgi:hypothetical protein